VITEFTWNPGAVAADLRFLVLVIVDQGPVRVVDPPAQFTTLDEVDAFALGAPGAATRLFVIGA
jgi:hypothetical protein